MIAEVVIPLADTDSNCMGYHHNLYDETDIIEDCIEYDAMNSTTIAPCNSTANQCHPVSLGKQATTTLTTTKPYHPLAKPPLTPTTTITSDTANRFTDAQRHRTLRHHRLPQPTPSQERAHLIRLRRNDSCRMSSSFCSMLTLPEEDSTSDQEEVVHLDLKQMQLETNEGRNATRKPSVDSEGSISNKMSTQSRTSSDRSLSSVSIDGDSFSDASPTTTLFVPGQEVTTIHKGAISSRNQSAAAVLPDVNLNTAFNPSTPYCQPCEMDHHSPTHRFVVCADTQFGITKNNESWQAEMEYSVGAVNLINAMEPRPAFVCVCGDLVDMEFSFEKKKGSKSKFPSTLFDSETGIASREVCDFIQDEQNEDFKKIWSLLHPDIALVCLCGNHDVGNRPTPRSIARFRSAFGDEYLAFWSNGSYNIVLNNVLFVDRSGAERIFNTQLRWLENRLQYARDHQAANIFVFAHHPWFLYDEEEDPEKLTGVSPYPKDWLASEEGETPALDSASVASFPDSYFSMPKKSRAQALELFREYNVKACFSGHFHQNLVSKTRWGMDMITTAPLSVVFESTGKKLRSKKTDRILVEEHQTFLSFNLLGRRSRKMTYESEEAMLNSSSSSCECKSCISEVLSDEESPEEANCRGVRVVDVQSSGGFRHRFVPL